MQGKFSKLGLVLGISVGLVIAAISGADAKKPEKNTPFPNGIMKKSALNERTNTYTYSGKSPHWKSEIADWNRINGITDEGGCADTGSCPSSTTVATSGKEISVCPTSLDDEQMRLCLGLPAVKKAVRVKKLNVQLGDAQ